MYIHGSGFIAKNLKKIKFKKTKKVTIYAAGVSNSKSKDKKIFIREIKKINEFLVSHDNKNLFIYISSISVLDNYLKKDQYIKNKIIIENLIKRGAKKYLILRLPQIVGKSSNPHTITNFIYKKISTNQRFKVWYNVKRNLIDIDDLIRIIEELVNKKKIIRDTVNIYNPYSIYVEEIVKIIANILRKTPKYELINYKPKIKSNVKIKNDKKFNSIIAKHFKSKNYFKIILKKYYK